MVTRTRLNSLSSPGRAIKILLFANIVALAVTLAASAQPPQGADPNSEIAKWFKSLKNGRGLPCCDISDCRHVEARLTNGHYEAFVDDRWSKVPDDTIRNIENRTGQYIACYSYYDYPGQSPQFYCFVPLSLVQSRMPVTAWYPGRSTLTT